jgi:hypothetical protein
MKGVWMVLKATGCVQGFRSAGHEKCVDGLQGHCSADDLCWAEAPIKIARMTLTIKLDGNWSSFQLANSAPPLSVTDSAIAPSARMWKHGSGNIHVLWNMFAW